MQLRLLLVVVSSVATAVFSNVANAQGLQMPVQGNWFVLQGPPCPAIGNHHCGAPSQHFAFDFVTVDAFGQPAPMLCFSQPVYSPSDGTVTAALDQYPNLPSPTQHPAGNHVVIQRPTGEVILLAHLSPGTVTVSVGSTVTAGQQIGVCGHNGNSSTPHVHVHMQSHPNILNFFAPPAIMNFTNAKIRAPGGACVPLGASPVFKGMFLC